MKWPRFRRWLAATLALAAGCAHRPATTGIGGMSVPATFAGNGGTAIAPDRWWTSFGDPRLSEWVDRALAGNVPLARAWARLAQARMAAVLAGADARPTLSAEASARRSRVAPGSLGRPSPAATFTQFTLGFAAAYEVDLLGRVAADVRAAEADLTAS